MSRDSESEHPSQRTVAELLAQHGGSSQRNTRRRRRRAEDPTETAPQAIIDRVNSDSGRMRPIPPEDDTAQPADQQPADRQPISGNGAAPEAASPSSQAPSAGSQAPPAGSQAPPAGSQAPPAGSPPATSPPPDAASGTNHETAGTSRPFRRANLRPGRFANGTVGSDGGTAAADVEVTAQQPAVSEQFEQPAHLEQPESQDASASASASAASPSETSDMPAVSTPGARGYFRQRGGVASSAPPLPGTDGATEQFPSVRGTVQQAPSEVNGGQWPAAGMGGTAVPAHPGTGTLFEPDSADRDEYDALYYDAEEDADDAVDDVIGGELDFDDDSGEELGVEEDKQSRHAELPAGMDAEDYFADGADAEEPERSPVREWVTLITQVGAGLVGGGAVWLGFRWLWTAIPVAALVAALVVTGALVFIARRFLRTDDLQTILLAVLVGLVCTVSPAALLLVGY